MYAGLDINTGLDRPSDLFRYPNISDTLEHLDI